MSYDRQDVRTCCGVQCIEDPEAKPNCCQDTCPNCAEACTKQSIGPLRNCSCWFLVIFLQKHFVHIVMLTPILMLLGLDSYLLNTTKETLSPCYNLSMQDRFNCLDSQNNIVCQFSFAVAAIPVLCCFFFKICLTPFDDQSERYACINGCPNKKLRQLLQFCVSSALLFVFMFIIVYTQVYQENCRTSDKDCIMFQNNQSRAYEVGFVISILFTFLSASSVMHSMLPA